MSSNVLLSNGLNPLENLKSRWPRPLQGVIKSDGGQQLFSHSILKHIIYCIYSHAWLCRVPCLDYSVIITHTYRLLGYCSQVFAKHGYPAIKYGGLRGPVGVCEECVRSPITPSGSGRTGYPGNIADNTKYSGGLHRTQPCATQYLPAALGLSITSCALQPL